MKGVLVLLCFAAGSIAFADDYADREKLAGTWESPDGARWVLDSKGDTIHVTEFDHDRKVSEFECNTVGKECEIKEAGKPVKVTMYYNGPRLVVMQTRGGEVRKLRFHATDDQLEFEVMPIVPQGSTQTVKLSRTTVAQK